MTVSQFIEVVRSNYLFDTQEPFLWSDDELLGYLNDVLEIVSQQLDLTTTEFLSTSEGTYMYPVPNGVLSIYQIPTLTKVGLIWLLNELPYGRKSKPFYWSINGDFSYIYLYPIPDGNYNFNLICKPRLKVSSPFDDLPFEAEFLFHGVIWRAYLKEDTEAFDSKLAAYHETEFRKALIDKKKQIIRDRMPYKVSPVHRGLL